MGATATLGEYLVGGLVELLWSHLILTPGCSSYCSSQVRWGWLFSTGVGTPTTATTVIASSTRTRAASASASPSSSSYCWGPCASTTGTSSSPSTPGAVRATSGPGDSRAGRGTGTERGLPRLNIKKLWPDLKLPGPREHKAAGRTLPSVDRIFNEVAGGHKVFHQLTASAANHWDTKIRNIKNINHTRSDVTPKVWY